MLNLIFIRYGEVTKEDEMRGARLKIENIEQLEKEVKESHPAQLKMRILFIKFLNDNNNDFDYACQSFQVKRATGYEWVHKWNKKGIEALKDGVISGRPASLSKEQLERLKSYLSIRDSWEIKEIKELIEEKFNVVMSLCNVYLILKHKLQLHYAKPYKKDYRRPDHAEEMLRQGLQKAFDQLTSYGIDPKDVAIGFLDEARPQNKANSARVWSVDKPHKQTNTQKFTVNTVGFYAIEGQSVLGFLEETKQEPLASFLREIRQANEAYEYIILILDNYKVHHTAILETAAFDLGILLVFLPPYSPDLNPIEFIWKSVKRVISKVFIQTEAELLPFIFGSFQKFSKSLGFAWSWIQEFLPKEYKNNILNCLETS